MDLLEKMSTYVRVIEAGSFSAAAKQVRLSPAAVSRQIAALESEVRFPLVLRSTRRMEVTPAGRRYYERCLRILREVDDAQSVGQSEVLDGLLQVSAPVSFGLARVVPHMHALMSKHPGVRIDLRLEDRLIDLAFDGMDVAIRVGGTPPESTDVIAHPLFAFRRVLVASPGYLKRNGEPKTPEAIAKHDALSYGVGTPFDSWALSDGSREARLRVNVIFRSNAVHATKALVLKGAGIALLPDWLVTEEVQRRTLRVILPAWKTELIGVHALHRTLLRGAPRVRLLIEHLRAAYA